MCVRADKLAYVTWAQPDTGLEHRLLDATDLREEYGDVIGKIADSHWCPVQKLPAEFDVPLGAPGFLPGAWTVDPLKIACLLRTTDAVHLDARRAPLFLLALRQPSGESRDHWSFQARLSRPWREHDRLIFTSGHRFAITEAASWWRCFDVLSVADRELEDVDALLADLGKARFAARGVAGAEEPARLARFVPTDGWMPVDTSVRVNDVAGLVRKLGGEELYGYDDTVPLRELIQDASDAVRARRCMEDRQPDWGDIHVRLGEDECGHWMEVEDNGIGMSPEVLAGPFLDFGTSYWGSDLMFRELPRLFSKGFESTGRYGIGFFSVFMWGDRATVTTRRPEASRRETHVLVFDHGVRSCPVLREATEAERRLDGGTCVRVWLDTPPLEPGGLLHRWGRSALWRIEDLCAWLCPSIDVNLYAGFSGSKAALAVAASDWITMDPAELLLRVWLGEDDAENLRTESQRWAGNVRHLRDSSGRVVGRACAFHRLRNRIDGPGVVTVGGLRCTAALCLAGVLQGKVLAASRNAALPVVDADEMRRWGNEQLPLLTQVTDDMDELAEGAQLLYLLGSDTGSLPLVTGKTGHLDADGVRSLAEQHGEARSSSMSTPSRGPAALCGRQN